MARHGGLVGFGVGFEEGFGVGCLFSRGDQGVIGLLEKGFEGVGEGTAQIG